MDMAEGSASADKPRCMGDPQDRALSANQIRAFMDAAKVPSNERAGWWSRDVGTMSRHALLAALLGLGAVVAQVPQEQPGALDLYPPSFVGSFTSVVNHYSFASPAHVFNINYMVYDGFAPDGETGDGNVPVLLYCGNEGSIDFFYNATGGMFEMGEELGAILVFVEHRYCKPPPPLPPPLPTITRPPIPHLRVHYSSLRWELPPLRRSWLVHLRGPGVPHHRASTCGHLPIYHPAATARGDSGLRPVRLHFRPSSPVRCRAARGLVRR